MGFQMIEIFIPSRSRWERSKTMESLQRAGIRDFKVVVPADQAKRYRPLVTKHRGEILACPVNGISATRHWIGQQVEGKKFIMLDDDLIFYFRAVAGPRLQSMSQHDPVWMRRMLGTVEFVLNRYAHAAISHRGGVQHRPYPYDLCARPVRALAYRKKEFLECEHGRVDIMEDFDITLQLFAKGYQNCLITKYSQDHQQTQYKGGCSDYRTHALHAKNVATMKRLHPDFVRLKKMKNTTGGAFGYRLEGTFYWKKAWEYTMSRLIGENVKVNR